MYILHYDTLCVCVCAYILKPETLASSIVPIVPIVLNRSHLHVIARLHLDLASSIVQICAACTAGSVHSDPADPSEPPCKLTNARFVLARM